MNSNSYDKSTPVINPWDIAKRKDNMPEVFISAFEGGFRKLLKEEFNPVKLGNIYAPYRISIYEILYDGKKIGFFQSPIGAPACVIAQEAVYETGAEKILYFGSCGCLDSLASSCDFLIPEKAYIDEGTSSHYQKKKDFINIPSSARLKEIFNGLKLPYLSCATWTTDAFLRETRNAVEKRRAKGCLCVEMECSAIMTVAEYRKKEAYQFLFAADNLDGEYDLGLLDGFNKDKRKYILLAALNAACKLTDFT